MPDYENLRRRDVLGALLTMPLATEKIYAQRTKGFAPLKIEDIKVIATSAGGDNHWVILKAITNEPGLYGVGSATNVMYSQAVVAAIEKHLVPYWVGKDPDKIEDLWQGTNRSSYWRNSTVHNNALAALDMALWDIKAKRAGMPLYQLLGGKVRDAVPLYVHADGLNFKDVAKKVRHFFDNGYRHIRAQLGCYGCGGIVPKGRGERPEGGYQGDAFDEEMYLENIPKLFEYLRVKLGAEPKLLHDVHEHLNPNIAVELAKRLEPYNLFFLEDILPPEQISWFRRIREVSTTPLAMGELFTNPQEWLPLIAERLIDFIRCDIVQIGGITPAIKLAHLCEAFGVRTAWHEGGDNDPVCQAACLHIDLAISSFGIQEEEKFTPAACEIFPGTAVIKRGYLYCNDLPGLGIDVDEKLAAKYPIRVADWRNGWLTVRGIDGSLVYP